MEVTKVLVTGGAGFIGSHTVDLLLGQNKQVIIIDNLTSGKKENLNLTHPNLQLIEGDILDYALIKKTVAECDAVLHLAAIVSVQDTIDKPLYSFQVNTQGHLHILQAIHETKKPVRLVYASSSAAYGEAKNLPCSDNRPLADPPISPYALQKINNEEYAHLYHSLYGVNSQGLRYFNVYGPRQDPNSPYSGVISRFLKAYQADNELTIFGDGNQSRDFIYVADVARANYLALLGHSQQTVNIATGQSQTLLNLIKHIEEAGDKKAKCRFDPPRVGDIYHSYAETQLARDILHFQYLVPLSEGIRLLVQPK
jgi:UDP-glucose 4-epimerase